MIDKHSEQSLELHMLFIDFKQALDIINRKRLFEAMDNTGITQKLALHNVAQEIDQRGTICTKSSQICVYAIDVVIVTTSETRMRQIYKEMEEKTQKMGLTVNKKKDEIHDYICCTEGMTNSEPEVGR